MPSLDQLPPGQISVVDDNTWQVDLLPELPGSGCYLLEISLDTGGAGDGTSERAGTADWDALFTATAAALDLPRDKAIRKWAGFQDRLWGDLAERFVARVYLVIRRADALLGGSLGELLTAVSVFKELARAVGGESDSFPDEMSLSIVLTGVGPDFPRSPIRAGVPGPQDDGGPLAATLLDGVRSVATISQMARASWSTSRTSRRPATARWTPAMSSSSTTDDARVQLIHSTPGKPAVGERSKGCSPAVNTELLPTLVGYIPPSNHGKAVTAPELTLGQLDAWSVGTSWTTITTGSTS